MKAGIHPEVHKGAKTTCMTCNAEYDIDSTVPETKVESCRNCHPIYTGEERQDRRGDRIERFQKRMAKKV